MSKDKPVDDNGTPDLTPNFVAEVTSILIGMNAAKTDAENIVALVSLARQIASYNAELKINKVEISIRQSLCTNLQSFILTRAMLGGVIPDDRANK